MSGALALGAAVPAALAEAPVVDLDGQAVAMATLWRERAALCVFLRHFGCIGCDQQVSELLPRLHELDEHGLAVAFIGSGDVQSMRAFREDFGLADKPLSLYTDETLASYRAAGLARSMWGVLGPRALGQTLAAAGRGYRQRSRAGDGSQQGGALIVDADGVLRFYFRSRSLGDRADPNELVQTALKMSLGRARARGAYFV
ncbi:MAG: AhpC/TSA family protein [Myxococcales bacterium]|nr:AhpC/TSA family protein [Myxococcales bacterium]